MTCRFDWVSQSCVGNFKYIIVKYIAILNLARHLLAFPLKLQKNLFCSIQSEHALPIQISQVLISSFVAPCSNWTCHWTACCTFLRKAVLLFSSNTLWKSIIPFFLFNCFCFSGRQFYFSPEIHCENRLFLSFCLITNSL